MRYQFEIPYPHCDHFHPRPRWNHRYDLHVRRSPRRLSNAHQLCVIRTLTGNSGLSPTVVYFYVFFSPSISSESSVGVYLRDLLSMDSFHWWKPRNTLPYQSASVQSAAQTCPCLRSDSHRGSARTQHRFRPILTPVSRYHLCSDIPKPSHMGIYLSV